ncbi:MAG: hypothetical protein IM631_13110 [Cytophagales bacterium]|nr:hypothetical protein [Cytophagales bacterium]MCA6372312.1 hypothetical protein [Cytophagales bacterium]MCA6382458.1 hypothetical protein [Cytophagales bacterium]
MEKIAGALNRRVWASLLVIQDFEKTFPIESLFKYYQRHGYFSPKQLLLLINAAARHHIRLDYQDFKTSLKKKTFKQQLADTQRYDIEVKLWPFLTDSQRLFYKEHFSLS